MREGLVSGLGPSKEDSLDRNALRGFLAGAVAGTIMAPIEYLKVSLQVQCQAKRNKIGFKDFFYSARKSIVPFAAIFGSVCAVQFSVNDYIEKRFGAVAGITAAAFSGGTLLVASDHMMFRQHTKQPLSLIIKELAGRKLFVGFSPMVAREAIYLTSTVYAGPYIGKAVLSGKEKESLYYHKFVGRMFTGTLFVLISHPFDSLARQMQMRHLKQLPTSYFSCLGTMHRDYLAQNLKIWEHPLLRGATPRMFLGMICGSISGTLYDYFKIVV